MTNKNKKEKEKEGEERVYSMANDEILLLLNEEGIEFIDVGVQEGDESGVGARFEAQQLLELLVGDEFVAPMGQCVVHLLLQPLPELHFLLEEDEERRGVGKIL